MNIRKGVSRAFIMILVLVFGCEKDDGLSQNQNFNSNVNLEEFAENFGQTVSRNFLGKVIDHNQNPIEGVQISINSSQVITDSNGVFIIRDAIVNERFGYIKAKKTGFIDASRAVVTTLGTNKIEIMMLPATTTGTTLSGEETTISLSNGAGVKLSGRYIKSDGTSYSGNVNVILHHLNSANENIQLQMPGMLYGADADNQERLLQTFGMLTVELRGENGEDLNLAENSTADLIIPLEQNLLDNAPSLIPLWYFDEDYGVWVEEGQAVLEGNKYVGTVSHFSTWNCDVPFQTVNLCIDLNILDSNSLSNTSNPASNLEVILSAPGYGSINGFSNAQGEVCLLVPNDVNLDISVIYSGSCSEEIIYYNSLGPYIEDSSITINIDSVPEQIYVSETIIGNFAKCNGEPVTDGYVEINYDGETYIDFIDNGDFEIAMMRCVSDEYFSFKAVDFEDNQEIGYITFQFQNEINNIGVIPTCNSIEEFIYININEYFIINEDLTIPLEVYENISSACQFNTELDSSGNLKIDWLACGLPEFRLTTCQFNGVNNYPIIYPDGPCFFGSGNDNQIYFKIEYSGNELPFQFLSGILNITSYGEVGEYVDFNITGQAFFTLSAIYNDVTITGHVLRDN